MSIREVLDILKTHQGLGDTVKAVTERVGIKQCEPCRKRQEMLNKVVPYKKP